MCGIIGFVSKKEQSTKILIEGLKQLEYRGYDSCGLASVCQNEMTMIKTKGKVKGLESLVSDDLQAIAGIAHTRWATHGEPSEVNAHPHQLEKVTLVHNGIIENSDELRKDYTQKGIVFQSETDTEVACAVLADCVETQPTKVAAIQKATTILKGSYAFAIIFEDELDRVYVVRKDSPLLLGVSDSTVFLASDCSAFLSYTNELMEIEEGEVALLHHGEITLFNQQQEEIQRDLVKAPMSLEEIQKDGFDTFMMKEIHEEPAVIKKTIHHYMNHSLDDLMDTMPDLSRYNRFVFVGCGSAYHAGMVARSLMERKARALSSAELASEFRYSDPLLDSTTAVIFISQSGETADTLAALRMCNKMGVDTFAIVNVLGSSLAKEAKYFLPTLAGKEISVATTKAYSCQISVLSLLCIKKALQSREITHQEKIKIEEGLIQLPSLIKGYIEQSNIDQFADKISDSRSVFFLGRGLDYALSLEGALKLKEISYLHCEAYPAGELKHGTISLIEQGTPVVACITEDELAVKTLSNLKEVQARGAKVILLIKKELYQESMAVDGVLFLPEIHPMLQAIVSIIPYQLLAYAVAKKRGCDIDQPRNLAKSVTVE